MVLNSQLCRVSIFPNPLLKIYLTDEGFLGLGQEAGTEETLPFRQLAHLLHQVFAGNKARFLLGFPGTARTGSGPGVSLWPRAQS